MILHPKDEVEVGSVSVRWEFRRIPSSTRAADTFRSLPPFRRKNIGVTCDRGCGNRMRFHIALGAVAIVAGLDDRRHRGMPSMPAIHVRCTSVHGHNSRSLPIGRHRHRWLHESPCTSGLVPAIGLPGWLHRHGHHGLTDDQRQESAQFEAASSTPAVSFASHAPIRSFERSGLRSFRDGMAIAKSACCVHAAARASTAVRKLRGRRPAVARCAHVK